MKAGSLIGLVAAAGAGAVLVNKARQAQDVYSFADKVVLITGGSRGLGLAIARELAGEGAKLALVARDGEELDRAKDDLSGFGVDVITIVADVGAQEQAQNAVRQVIDQWGQIDLLINDAGIIQVGPLENLAISDFQDAMAAHMWGPLYTMLAAVPAMKKRGEGRIVNISSVGGKIAVPHLLPYSTSKFALVGLSDGFRAELAKDNIHVTTVAPGLMRTGSPVNALFKGQQEKEYSWFTLLNSLFFTSISAERAAQQIITATRTKRPELTITVQAKLGVLASHLAPSLFARVMQLTAAILPKQDPIDGDKLQTGSASESSFSRSPLTKSTYDAAAKNNELGL